MPLNPGAVFAGYTVIRQLGAGGMGEVYLVQHPRLPRTDALKVLPEHVADGESRQRFLREADVAARLSHPNIVSVLDRGEENGRLWISMQFVDGDDAERRVREQQGGLALPLVDRIVTDAAAGLDHAHAHGVLHRDVKPANIMLTGGDADTRALLTDFGIARAFDDAGDVTRIGTAVGSVAYASPEQLQALPLDARTDVYSLAATAYNLLTGHRPFDRPSSSAVIAAALRGSAPVASSLRGGLPATVDQVLARAMATDPQHRPASAGEFAADLHRALTGAGSAPLADPGQATTTVVPQGQQPTTPYAQTQVGYPAGFTPYTPSGNSGGFVPGAPQGGYAPIPGQYPPGYGQAAPQYAYAPEPPKNRTPLIVAAVAVVAIVVAGGIAAVLLTKDSRSSRTTAATTTGLTTTAPSTVTTVAPPVTVTESSVVTITTTTAAAPAIPSYQSQDEMGAIIRRVGIGDCVYYTYTGSTNNIFYQVPCSSTWANYTVQRTGTVNSVCDGLPGRYVWTENASLSPTHVVVCVVPK